MKFKIVITTIVLLLVYFQVKTAYWAENVAAPYMEALYYTNKCTRLVVFENRIPILERMLGIRAPLKKGAKLNPEMVEACNKKIQRWDSYETKRVKYKKWFVL